MIQRRTPIPRSRKPAKRSGLRPATTRPPRRRKGPARRGRVIQPVFERMVRSLGCILRGKHRCIGPVTFHHLKKTPGAQKDDTWGVGLCADGHLITFNSSTSVEALGKRKFELHWGVSLEAEAEKNRERWERGERAA